MKLLSGLSICFVILALWILQASETVMQELEGLIFLMIAALLFCTVMIMRHLSKLNKGDLDIK